ncbi:MAG: ATP-grasp domain-containing protein [Bacteroidetes bacterium]|nr:ATP-grasp domain-containing protein [Bacteroidota bacterium]
MILLDLPYVSDFLKETITRNSFQTYEPSGARHFIPGREPYILTSEEAVEVIRKDPGTRIYTNSENSIHWIAENLGFTGLPSIIRVFKDKVAFRRLTQDLFPEVFFKEVEFDEIEALHVEALTFPFVIKPSVGFFSLGVYTVNQLFEWDEIKKRIHDDIQHIRKLYPKEVLDTSKFLVEQYIKGVEYAFDAYFDENGKPVILNILKHLFASGDDVSDRIYVTSKSILLENLPRLTGFLEQLNSLVPMKNFPLHVEVRIDENGRCVPIEVNPLRFGGWCTTADTTWFAYGINSYEYFLNNIKPDWPALLAKKDDSLFSLVVLNNSTGIPGKEIRSFNFDQLLTHFQKPLELRKVDHTAFPLFGFLFIETNETNTQELEWILKDNLREFVAY